MDSQTQTVSEAALHESVARTNEWYARREQDEYIVRLWQPLQEDEVNTRCQQYRQLARGLRAKGVLSLKGWRALDVGCGNGRSVRLFVELGAAPDDVCGLEIRPSAVAEARRLSPHQRFDCFDGIRIPFDDGSFDLVTQHVCFTSILSADVRLRLAAEMWRVLRPGGYVFWWDMPTTRGPTAEYRDRPVCLDELFPNRPRADALVDLLPWPDECARPFRGARLLRPLLQWFRRPAGFCASLIGPK